MGNFTISDTVFRQIIEHIAKKMPNIYKVIKTRVSSSEEGTNIYMEVTVVYGSNVKSILKEFKEKAKKEIENLTAMNVVSLEIIAKNIYVPEKNIEIQNFS